MTASGNQQTKNKIIRDVFRFPVEKNSTMSVVIEGTTFEVINIVANGIGILIDKDVTFDADRHLDSIELYLDGEKLHLQGRIIHISPREFQLICGIELINISKENAEKISSYLQKTRKHLFGEK